MKLSDKKVAKVLIYLVLAAMVITVGIVAYVNRSKTTGEGKVQKYGACVMPGYLAASSKDRYPVDCRPLTKEWSKRYYLASNYAPEVIPLDEGAEVEVRPNGRDDLIYTKNSNNEVNGESGKKLDINPDYIEVRAADGSVGKGNFVISFVK